MPRHHRTIHRQIRRPPRDILRRLAALDVATIYESNPGGGVMTPEIRSINSGRSICGPAMTADNVAGDNLAMHAALDLCGKGDVLVVATNSAAPAATWGALVTRTAIARSLGGVVTDGWVRDVEAVRDRGLAVWARGISPIRASKQRIGGVNIPVSCGGVLVEPGDIVVADDDGVVIVRASNAHEVASAAEARFGAEMAASERLDRGASPFEVYSMASLDADVAVVDGPWPDLASGRPDHAG